MCDLDTKDEVKQIDVIVVGAGLAGLTATYLLKMKGFNVRVVEADSKIGGRIKTVVEDRRIYELGATWVFDHNTTLRTLLKKLNIKLYNQFVEGLGLYEIDKANRPHGFDTKQVSGGTPYYKIKGGSAQIVQKLFQLIGEDFVKLGTKIKAIESKHEHIKVISEKGEKFKARYVIVTVPPRLLETSISFHPILPSEKVAVMRSTHTWMAESIKFTIHFTQDFWRNKGLAGMIVSGVGTIMEVQDHSSPEDGTYALLGFLREDAITLSLKEREKIVVEDLVRILGEEASDYIAYKDATWADAPLTSSVSVNRGLTIHQYNGHDVLVRPEMNGKLLFAGAETSKINPGYMEGAVLSAFRVVKEIEKASKN